MKRGIGVLLCAILTIGGVTACMNNTDATKPVVQQEQSKDIKQTKESETVAGEKIKVWHDGNEAIMQTIADRVNEVLADQKITLVFEKKAALSDQLRLYGNDKRNGPDMYFYAHDSLGSFAEMGILAPVTDIIEKDTMADFLPMTIEACTYKDTQYLLPVYFETLLFMYNKTLWEGNVPTTTEALYAYMQSHTDSTAGTYAVVNQHSTAYNVAPFINGFGGYIIDKEAKPGLDEQSTKEAITYNKKFAALQADGDYNTVTTLFNEKKASAIIGGPWLIPDINKAGIDLGIKSLSTFTLPNGNGLAPYSGVQGIGVMKYVLDSKKEAVKAVLEAIADTKLGIDLAKKSNCAPANLKSYEDADVAANEMIVAIKDTAKTAEPMPNIPQMGVMWGPAEELLAVVNKNGEDVETAAEKFQKNALTAIEDMK